MPHSSPGRCSPGRQISVPSGIRTSRFLKWRLPIALTRGNTRPSKVTGNRIEDLRIDGNIFIKANKGIGVYGAQCNGTPVPGDHFENTAITRYSIGARNRFSCIGTGVPVSATPTQNMNYGNVTMTEGRPPQCNRPEFPDTGTLIR